MATLDSLLAAARYRLRLLDPGEMVRWADDLLIRGVYTYSLGELATGAAFRASHEWFLAALGELSVAVPSEKEAVDLLLARWIEDIAERRQEPQTAVIRFGAETRPWQSENSLHAVASSHPDYRTLIGFYYEYNDFHYEYDEVTGEGHWTAEQRERGRLELAARVVKFATGWVAQRYRDAFLECDWSAGGVTALDVARTIREERRYEDLPVLADALEEAGFTNTDVLEHCRRAEEHPSGCWVVELLLEPTTFRAAANAGDGHRRSASPPRSGQPRDGAAGGHSGPPAPSSRP
jgi:hypothetical protein